MGKKRVYRTFEGEAGRGGGRNLARRACFRTKRKGERAGQSAETNTRRGEKKGPSAALPRMDRANGRAYLFKKKKRKEREKEKECPHRQREVGGGARGVILPPWIESGGKGERLSIVFRRSAEGGKKEEGVPALYFQKCKGIGKKRSRKAPLGLKVIKMTHRHKERDRLEKELDEKSGLHWCLPRERGGGRKGCVSAVNRKKPPLRALAGKFR